MTDESKAIVQFLRSPGVYEVIRSGMACASAQEIVDTLCDVAERFHPEIAALPSSPGVP